MKEVCLQNVINTEQAIDFTINNLEIISRRNKRNEPCITNYWEYDHAIVNMHIAKLGCRPPYLQPGKNITTCTSKEKMHQAMDLDIDFLADDAIQPCLSVGDIRYTQSTPYSPKPMSIGPNATWLSVTPPKKIKMIHQVRNVNMQTVIGNAGGYIGLFLGKCYHTYYCESKL